MKSRFKCKLANLLKYKYRVWDLIESFKAFNLTPLPREKNKLVDLLATLVANLLPVSRTEWREFTIEVVPFPFISDNVEKFQVFIDNVQVLQFMMGLDAFKAQHIDWSEDLSCQTTSGSRVTLEGIEGVISLKDNKIPKGMVSLERMLNLDLPPEKHREPSSEGQGVIPLNLGMLEHL